MSPGARAAAAMLGPTGAMAGWWLAHRTRRRAVHAIRDELVRMRTCLVDVTTGLPLRSVWEADVAPWIRESQPHPGLVMLDLDAFKSTNDQHGHLAGDRVLAVVAARLREALGPRARIARLGGDEFAAVDAGLDAAAVGRFEQLMRQALVVADGARLHIRASTGLVAPGELGAAVTLSNALQVADARLYAAKPGTQRRRGRPIPEARQPAAVVEPA